MSAFHFHTYTEIEKALKEKGVECIMLCNPGNPTGRVWTKEEIQKLTALTKQYNSYLILDEIYCDMTFDGASHYSPINGMPVTLLSHKCICAIKIGSC